jgi:hypothetical protein
MNLKLSDVGVLAIVAALAACTAVPASYHGFDASALYSRLEVSSAGAQGPVPVLVAGAPFADVAAPRLAAATATGLSRAGAVRPMVLMTGPPPPRSVDYRIVVAYGEAMVGANGLCADPAPALVTGSELRATAAFCIGDRLLSTVRGRTTAAPAVPEDPAFQDFLAGLGNALLPFRNPSMPRRCGFGMVC